MYKASNWAIHLKKLTASNEKYTRRQYFVMSSTWSSSSFSGPDSWSSLTGASNTAPVCSVKKGWKDHPQLWLDTWSPVHLTYLHPSNDIDCVHTVAWYLLRVKNMHSASPSDLQACLSSAKYITLLGKALQYFIASSVSVPSSFVH